MNETVSAWLLYGAYAAFVAFAVLRSRAGASFRKFSVGARDVSPVAVGLSVAAAATSSATFVVNPGLVYLYGWPAFVGIYVASSLGLFVGLVVFSKSFRRIGDRFDALTLPQWIGDRYGSDGMRAFYAVVSLLQVAYLVLVVVAISVIVVETLGVPRIAAVIGVVAFTFSTILLGGAAVHVRANVVQAIVMLVVAGLLVASGWEHLEGGLSRFVGSLESVGPNYAALTDPESRLYRDLFETLFAQFVIGFASTLLPHLISKPLYLRSEREVNTYLGTAIVAVLGFKSVLLAGLFARLSLADGGLQPDSVMAAYIGTAFGPSLRALVGFGILAAGFSTLEGILLSLSSIVGSDLIEPLRRRFGWSGEGARRGALLFARGFILLLAPVTVLLSYRQIVAPSLSVIIFAFQGILGALAATFVPVLAGIYLKRPPKRVVLAASVVGLLVFYVMVLGELGPYNDNPMVPGTFALLASVLVLAAGLLLSRGPVELADRGAESGSSLESAP